MCVLGGGGGGGLVGGQGRTGQDREGNGRWMDFAVSLSLSLSISLPVGQSVAVSRSLSLSLSTSSVRLSARCSVSQSSPHLDGPERALEGLVGVELLSPDAAKEGEGGVVGWVHTKKQ